MKNKNPFWRKSSANAYFKQYFGKISEKRYIPYYSKLVLTKDDRLGWVSMWKDIYRISFEVSTDIIWEGKRDWKVIDFPIEEGYTTFYHNQKVWLYRFDKSTRDRYLSCPVEIRQSIDIKKFTSKSSNCYAVMRKGEVSNFFWGVGKEASQGKYFIFQREDCSIKKGDETLLLEFEDEIEFKGKTYFVHQHKGEPCLCQIGY